MARVKKLVVDSSVVVKWVNRQEENHLVQSDKLFNDCRVGKVQILAPELAKYEIGNVLWKKGLELPAAQVSLAAIYSGLIEFVRQEETDAMLAMEVATKAGMTFYDATFVAMAKKLGAFLVTDNPKHQKKFAGVKVVPLKDYC